MKVLKFGGTSVGSVSSILSLQKIVEKEAKHQPIIVVVSALGGITDQLIATSQLALKGDESWKTEFDSIVARHHKMIDAIITDPHDREMLFNKVDSLFEQLHSIYYGVFLIHDLSHKTEDTIVSYGERLSSRIVATLIRGAKWFDAREFIKTEEKLGKRSLDSELTNKLVVNTFSDLPRISLVPGFIAQDRDSGDITNLGRGGSDYTASILAASLNAEVLEIWTDVDGFMTADPRVIKSAYTINELSYTEAMELCNFGAKVVYPPTIYPVCVKNIPIKVKNTFNPDGQGTIIKAHIENNQKPIKGLSSIKGTTVITVTGLSMVGVVGVNRRIFSSLANNGISVIAIAQGASEMNISFVVKGSDLRKALNVLHDSLFLSEYKVLNLFICGIGTVGGKLIEQIKSQYEELKQNSNLKLKVVGIASSKNAIFNHDGLNLDNYRKELKEGEPSNPEHLRNVILKMNIFNSVFVDCTASKEVAALYQSLLENNISVIAANKIAASGTYDDYYHLKQTAIQRGVKFRFETNVGAGLPIIGTINDLRNSGDKILKIEAVLSGTLNFIFNEIGADVPFSETVKRAKEQGYSEPDPRIDLSGTDVVRKLVILTREAGYKVEQEDVEKHLFVPDDYFQGSVEDFWRRLPELDANFEQRRQLLAKEGKRWRFVATMEHGKTNVALKEVDSNHPFYNLEGSNNIVLLTTDRYKEYPMQIQGYGAGASVTAAGVFANIMSIANI